MPNIEIMIAVPGLTPPALAPRIFPSDQIEIGQDLTTQRATVTRNTGGFGSALGTYEAYEIVHARLSTLNSGSVVFAEVSADDLTAAQAAYDALLP